MFGCDTSRLKSHCRKAFSHFVAYNVNVYCDGILNKFTIEHSNSVTLDTGITSLNVNEFYGKKKLLEKLLSCQSEH